MKNVKLTLLFSLILVLALVCCLPIASAAASSITTMFNANSHAAGNMFDVTVKSDSDLVIESFDINITSDNGSKLVTVYYREGGYSGYETNAGAWTRVDSVIVNPQGHNSRTPFEIKDIRLTSGKTYGFYITLDNNSDGKSYMRYTYSSGSATYEDDNLKVFCGNGLSQPFDTIWAPRIWNGTIHYSIAPALTPTIAPTATPTVTPNISEVPQTGDPVGNSLWIYFSVAILSASACLLIIKKYFVRKKHSVEKTETKTTESEKIEKNNGE